MWSGRFALQTRESLSTSAGTTNSPYLGRRLYNIMWYWVDIVGDSAPVRDTSPAQRAAGKVKDVRIFSLELSRLVTYFSG